MPDQFDDIKNDLGEVKDRLMRLITMHEVTKRDVENVEGLLSGVQARMEKLEGRVETVRDKQLSTAWLSHIATAVLTGAGTTIAVILFNTPQG